jgi:hypothetical protein
MSHRSRIKKVLVTWVSTFMYIAIRITIAYTKKSVFRDLVTYLVKKVAVTGRTAPLVEAVPLIEEAATSDENEMSSDKPQTSECM